MPAVNRWTSTVRCVACQATSAVHWREDEDGRSRLDELGIGFRARPVAYDRVEILCVRCGQVAES
jgi:hypothetical protein